MKSKKVFLAAAVVIAGILAVAVAWPVYRELTPRCDYYTIDASAPLTEESAVKFTRRALMDDGKAAAGMIPIPYSPDSQFDNPDQAERLFARNTINRNSGYVL